MPVADRQPLHFDPYDPALHRDPYPVYRRLREEAPAFWNEALAFTALSRWEDVDTALRHPEVYTSAEGIAVGLGELPQTGPRTVPLLISMDGPRHTRMRALVSRAFTPRRIAELEPRIREIARELLDAMRDRERCDLVHELAGPLPATVIAELLGVPSADRGWFRAKSSEVAQFDPARVRESAGAGLPLAAAAELADYLKRALDERRGRPRDDLLSALLAAEIDGERLSEVELIGFAFLLLVAGNETTTNLISNASILLALHPDQRALLAGEPGRIATAVEEFLRFDPPVQGLARTLTRDVTLHGRQIVKGEKVLLLFASANRDERRIAEPERFDVTRDPNPHLSFGFGSHFCLGASLARLEARVAFEELLARHPGYALCEPEVERLCSGPVRGAVRLPVALS